MVFKDGFFLVAQPVVDFGFVASIRVPEQQSKKKYEGSKNNEHNSGGCGYKGGPTLASVPARLRHLVTEVRSA